MNTKDTGGPAFSDLKNGRDHDGDRTYELAGGMTLRDYFAAKAMQAYLTTPHADKVTVHVIAECAYDMADAMIFARYYDAKRT